MPDARSAISPSAIVLAAGRGTRMGGDLPKVLYPVADRPMVRWVIDACKQADCEKVVVVVGYKSDRVREALADEPACEFVEQTEQLGTAHAALMAKPSYQDQPAHEVFVLAGDGPLIRGRTLRRLLEVHREGGAVCSLATSVLDDPTGYGRIVRDADGRFVGIVEQKDATPEQLTIHEVNPSYYCFDSRTLFDSISKVSNNNTQNEYYLTDIPALLLAESKGLAVVDAVPASDVLSINNPAQLAEVDAVLRERLQQAQAAETQP